MDYFWVVVIGVACGLLAGKFMAGKGSARREISSPACWGGDRLCSLERTTCSREWNSGKPGGRRHGCAGLLYGLRLTKRRSDPSRPREENRDRTRRMVEREEVFHVICDQVLRGNKSVAVLGNYVPRQCGIATFTTDLVEGLSAEAPEIFNWAAAMNDRTEGYAYPEKVRFEINQNKLNDYSVASQFINISQTDIVCVQHEYGLFGGPAGSHLLKLLGDLRMPVVTTLHTVLKDPARSIAMSCASCPICPTSWS